MYVIPDVLRKAANIIDIRGWTRGKDLDESGVCANGAIRMALGHVPFHYVAGRMGLSQPPFWTVQQVEGAGRAITATHRALDEYMIRFGVMRPVADDPVPRVIRFNDGPAWGAEAVTKVLRDAADWIESAPVAELERVTAGLASGDQPHATADAELVAA